MGSEKCLYVYVGDAGLFAQPVFVQRLAELGLTRGRHHREISRLDKSTIAKLFRSAEEERFERVFVCVGRATPDPGAAVETILVAAVESNVFEPSNRPISLEVLVSLAFGDCVGLLLGDLEALSRASQNTPKFTVWVLLNETRTNLAEFLTATSITEQSRWLGVDMCLSALRDGDQRNIIAVTYDECELPDIGSLSSNVSDQALFRQTFAVARQSVGTVGRERLLAEINAHWIDREEPSRDSSALSYRERLAQYGSGILHRIVCVLLSAFPEYEALVEGIRSLSVDLAARSQALSDLLAGCADEIVATNDRLTRFANIQTDWIDRALVAEHSTRLASGLCQRFAFPLWPVIRANPRVRNLPLPNPPELDKEYQACRSRVESFITNMVRTHVRLLEQGVERRIDQYVSAGGIEPLRPKTMVIVSRRISNDERDELWPDNSRCGIMGLLTGRRHNA